MTARVSFGERARGVALAVGWVLLYGGVGGAASWVLIQVVPLAPDSPWRNGITLAAVCVSFGFATWLVGVRWSREPWAHWGWGWGWGGDGSGRSSARARDGLASLAGLWVNGAGLGLLMAALAVGLAYVASGARVWMTPDWRGYAAAVAPLALVLLAAALLEELLFRGYPLRRLSDALGAWPATTLLIVAFGLAHIANPNITAAGILNIVLAGLWLSVAFFSPGGMPLAWGLHFGWNAGLSLAFDAPVSGQRFLVPGVEYAAGARSWIDGGTFGPEGGVAATLVLVAGTLAVAGRRYRRPREWLL